MSTSLPTNFLNAVHERLHRANLAASTLYPGDRDARQPVHTVYGGAHLFRAETAGKLGSLALRSLEHFAPDPATFAEAIGLSSAADDIYHRVVSKLSREPVEDYRLDFEDGYGIRPDAEEDSHAGVAAAEVAAGLRAGTLPPFIGIRIKPFTEELRERSIRTLDIFLTELIARTSVLPPNFVVTLPKVTTPDHNAALSEILGELESRLALAPRALTFEVMVETTQAILNERGEVALPRLIAASGGRCVAAHFGTYDYTAACNITAAYQHMAHPACDFAKHVMQVALAGTGVWLSDGATNVMPIAPHRPAFGQALSDAQKKENRSSVHSAWRLHFEHIRRSLTQGFYQGWDLHPAQLPTRYAAVYSFFLESLAPAATRLRNFVEKAAQATVVGDVFDDAATGQGLLNYFLRAINCGAISEDEAGRLTSLTLDELRSRSFLKILQNRR